MIHLNKIILASIASVVISLNGTKVALAKINGYLPHLFHSEDGKEGSTAMVERKADEFVGH